MDPKTIFEPHMEHKSSPLGPQKVKNNHKSKSKSNVRIQGIIENETTWVDPKTAFEPHIEPKTSPLGPQKVKNNLKIGSNLKVRIEKIKKMKIVQLHE